MIFAYRRKTAIGRRSNITYCFGKQLQLLMLPNPKKILAALCTVGYSLALAAQPVIYKDATTLITGTWNVNGTLAEVSGNSPFEGLRHYQFAYNYTEYWAGFGLNMDNWGNGPTYDFSGHTHLRIAYRGLSGNERLRLTLRSTGNIAGNETLIGLHTAQYSTVDVPLLALAAGTALDLSNISELMLGVSDELPEGSGTVYVDAIELVNIPMPTVMTSAATWQRAQNMQRGINLSNWLEAYWLIPFGAYPETGKYTAATFADFKALGVDIFRLPVTFEHLASSSPPYSLDIGHPAFDLVAQAIQWAADEDVKLIIDMHHGTTTLTDANYAAELPRLRAIWQQLIARYGYLDPERYFFEIYNEPHAISDANFRIVAQALIDDIRDAGAPHSIFLGASGYNSAANLTAFTPLDDPDIIYTFHFYGPYSFTHQQMSWTSSPYFPVRPFPQGDEMASMTSTINAVGDWADYYDVPVVAGEFGVTANADADSRCRWVEAVSSLFDDNSFPWIYWDPQGYSDGFGFFDEGLVSEATMMSCFGTALGLSGSPSAVAGKPYPSSKDWKVYPNPVAAGGIYLESPLDGDGQLTLYNSMGQRVHGLANVRWVLGQSLFLPLPPLPAGTYWLQISYGPAQWDYLGLVVNG